MDWRRVLPFYRAPGKRVWDWDRRAKPIPPKRHTGLAVGRSHLGNLPTPTARPTSRLTNREQLRTEIADYLADPDLDGTDPWAELGYTQIADD